MGLAKFGALTGQDAGHGSGKIRGFVARILREGDGSNSAGLGLVLAVSGSFLCGAVLAWRYCGDEGGYSLVLVLIRLLHTVIWAFFAGCIVALPLAAFWGRLDCALGLTLVVLFECGVLAVNRGRCPLTAVAARYTDSRADNFDIYLPAFIARHNKVIFGSLFVLGVLVMLWRWLA